MSATEIDEKSLRYPWNKLFDTDCDVELIRLKMFSKGNLSHDEAIEALDELVTDELNKLT